MSVKLRYALSIVLALSGLVALTQWKSPEEESSELAVNVNFTLLNLSAIVPQLHHVLRDSPAGHMRGHTQQLIRRVTAAQTSADIQTALEDLLMVLGHAHAPPLKAVERRVIYASVLLSLDANKDVYERSTRLRGTLDKIAAWLCSQRNRVAGPGLFETPPLFMLHFSKAGGTSMCNLAKLNGCTRHPKQNNCNPPENGPTWHRSFSKHTEISCRQYEAMATEHVIRFLGTEDYLDGGVEAPVSSLCSSFKYITMLRQPGERVVSHMKERGLRGAGDEYQGLPVASRVRMTPEIIDNYMVRVLLGEKGYQSPAGTLTDEHVQAAKRVLELFDVILLLEQKEKSSNIISKTMGWEKHSLDDKVGRGHAHTSHVEQLSKADQETVKKHTQLDQQLYDYAWLLMDLDDDLFLKCPAATPLC